MPGRIQLLSLAGMIAFAPIAALAAQAVVRFDFTGTVLARSTHDALAGVEVAIPSLRLADVTNARGQFRLAGVPEGEHRVLIRKIGYVMLDTSFRFTGDGSASRTLYLSQIHMLDSVVTVGAMRDFGMEDFERHRRMGLGHFYTRADIEKFTGQRISNLISQTNGIRMVLGRAGEAWVASARGQKSLGARSSTTAEDVRNGADPTKCYAQVYLDNMLVYNPQRSGAPLFDINSISPGAIEAIEYYGGASQIPTKYMKLSRPCGVLVIHTRR